MKTTNIPGAIRFDGFDLATGQATLRSLSALEAARFALAQRPGASLEMARSKAQPGFPTAWALVCRPDLDPAVLEALRPLISHRNGQVLPYAGELDLWSWESHLQAQDILLESSMDLLLVGDPQQIPWDFQQTLTPQHAVGRLWLPNASACDRYVQAVLVFEAAHDAPPRRRCQVEVFAPDDTPATMDSRGHLAEPLLAALPDGETAAEGFLGPLATAGQLRARWQSYAEIGAPGLILMPSHGLEVAPALQARYQGSWVPQGAPALGHAPSPEEIRRYCLTGDELSTGELSPYGAVVFNYACFGAGVQQEFALYRYLRDEDIQPDAAQPLVGALGVGLLGNPRPALAYVSTLDRRSNCFSLMPNGLRPFRDFARHVMAGWPIGLACRAFWQQSASYLQGAVELQEQALQKGWTAETMPEDAAWPLALNWVMSHELDSIVVLGDPAVSLR